MIVRFSEGETWRKSELPVNTSQLCCETASGYHSCLFHCTVRMMVFTGRVGVYSPLSVVAAQRFHRSLCLVSSALNSLFHSNV